MRKNLGFRGWLYFRNGWSTYFAFIFAAVNTLTVTYYLAIKDVPVLKAIFPSFIEYLVVVSVIGVPILIFIGYIHFKKTAAYSAEIDIYAESNPYYYKIPPGYNQQTLFPFYLAMINLLIKLSNNEKITEEDSKEINRIKKELDHLIKGGYVGTPKAKTNLDDKIQSEDKDTA